MKQGASSNCLVDALPTALLSCEPLGLVLLVLQGDQIEGRRGPILLDCSKCSTVRCLASSSDVPSLTSEGDARGRMITAATTAVGSESYRT